MGQGLGVGFCSGAFTNLVLFTIPLPVSQRLMLQAAFTGTGLSVDLASDLTAKTGKIIPDRGSILCADNSLRHVYSFYCTNEAHPVAKFVKAKHEWIVFESRDQRNKFFTVQKIPETGDVVMEVAATLRHACDHGLRAAKRPAGHGEIRLHRADQEFDLPDDLQLAYVIAWLRKEDPRWAFSTENSRHFCTRLRMALTDF